MHRIRQRSTQILSFNLYTKVSFSLLLILLDHQAYCHAEDLLFFVLEAMRHLKPANRSEVIKVEAVWAGLSSLLDQVAPDTAASNLTGQ